MKRKQVTRKIIFVFLIYVVLGVLLLDSLVKTSYQLYTKNKEKKKFQEELEVLKDTEDELKGQVNKLQDPDYIARYARENYSYSKNGEYIIKLNEEDKTKNDDVSFSQFVVEKIKGINIDYLYIIDGVIIIAVIIIVKSSKNKK